MNTATQRLFLSALLLVTACRERASSIDRTASAAAPAGMSADLISVSGLNDPAAPGGFYLLTATFVNDGTLPITAGDHLVSRTVPQALWTFTHMSVGRTVAPGETFQLVFGVRAPSSGPASFVAQLYHNAADPALRGHFGDSIDLTPAIDPAAQPAYSAAILSQTYGGPYTPGERVTFTITVQNTGSSPWTGSAYRLKNINPSLWRRTDVKLSEGETIAPGGTRVFVVDGYAPLMIGNYPAQWQMNHLSGAFFGAAASGTVVVGGTCDEVLVGVGARDNLLRTISMTDATTVGAVPINFAAGPAPLGANGLAVHPGTGELYALLRSDNNTRFVARIDRATGAATAFPNTGRRFATIAFDAAGTLFAITGDGDPIAPETLHTINAATGSSTSLCSFGGGDDGEALAFNPADGRLYHASGVGLEDVTLERVDSTTSSPCAVTDVDVASGTPLDAPEPLAITYSTASSAFYWSGSDNTLFRVTPGGDSTAIGMLDENIKGLAIVCR